MKVNFFYSDNQGFTLVEIMLAIIIFAIGIIGTVGLQVRNTSSNAKAQRLTNSTGFSIDRLEFLLERPYTHADLNDTDGDGTGQDANNDGVDDNSDDDNGDGTFGDVGDVIEYGEDFGLYDKECCPGSVDPGGNNVAGCIEVADSCRVIDDYFVYWNVAIDYPVQGVKTIRVIVEKSGTSNQIIGVRNVMLPEGNGQRRSSYRNCVILTNIKTTL